MKDVIDIEDVIKNKGDYRVKTLEEFGGSTPYGWNTKGKMNYLFGVILSSLEISCNMSSIWVRKDNGDSWLLRVNDIIKINNGVVIVDIDGTISDLPDWKDILKIGGWSGVYKNICKAEPIEPICSLVKLLQKDNKIYFVTARDYRYMQDTRKWLDKHIGGEYELYMGTINTIDDGVAKYKEAVIREIGTDNISLFIDDNQSCIEMANRYGIKTISLKLK